MERNYRWVVVALLFFATAINYIDRQIIGLLKPVIEKDFHWTETDYGRIIMAFSITYAIGLFLFGRLIDRIGTKKGYSLSIILWSIAAMLHALVKTTGGFVFARGFLGLGESGNFAAAIKAVAEWFSQKERALATGLFNAGSSIGAVVAPLIVPVILGAFGWQAAFVITGVLGFIWLIFWLVFYEAPGRRKGLRRGEAALRVVPGGVGVGSGGVDGVGAGGVSADEEDADEAGAPVGWMQLLGLRQTWAFIVGKFLTDPIWWFFLFWLPSYFSSVFSLDLTHPSLQLGTIYISTTIGSVGGGFLSSWLIRKHWPVFRARKVTLLLAAICVLPILFAKEVENIWAAVALISLAAAAHNAWSANLFTIVTDMFPKKALSSVVGIGGMAGSVGGILFPLFAGYLLDLYKGRGHISGGYNILFIICGFAYLLAWLIIHWLTPRMKKVTFDPAA
jgi:ACS family hexuronate transporter-like MFS transporter